MNRLTLLQREIIIWLVFFIVISTASVIYIEGRRCEYEGVLRFHVIANSDSKEDQALKLKIRDEIVGSLEKEIPKAAKKQGQSVSEEFTRSYVKENLDKINQKAAKVVKENGYSYRTTARLGVTHIPEKTYEDLTFPEGNYEALNIVIGKGQGKNWFCVIYPPLCLLGEEEGEGPILKSKIKEMVQSQN